MCNAWNHSPSCTCGWGGDTGGGLGGSFGLLSGGIARTSQPSPPSRSYHLEALKDVTEPQLRDSETRKTKCWWCGAEVYYHTNGYGDCVLFDELGWPWLVHECWEEHRREQSESFYARVEITVHVRLAVLIGAVNQIQLLPDECSVAANLGISIEQLRRGYGDLYKVDPSTGAVEIVEPGQIKSIKPPIYQLHQQRIVPSKSMARTLPVKRLPRQQIIAIRRMQPNKNPEENPDP